jgi:hypothetical protein
MVDKSRDPNALTQKVHNAGGKVGRVEFDSPEGAVPPPDSDE